MPKLISYLGPLCMDIIGQVIRKRSFERPWMIRNVDKKLHQEIYDEIMRSPGNKATTDNRELYSRLLCGHVKTVRTPKAPLAKPYAALSTADRSLLLAYEELRPDGILTDDKTLCIYCRKNAIPYINTPMALFVLLYNGLITHNQYVAHLQTLYETGRYGQFVYTYMQELYRSYCDHTNKTQ